MIEIVLAVALFAGIVVSLAALVLGARAWLMPSGEAVALVNGEREVAVRKGAKLSTGLGAAGIHLPSGCGGKGTCGQCRVRVTAGGGPVLPTETSVLARREIAQGVRLACQLTVRQDLEVFVPEDVLGVEHWICRVRSARCVATFIKAWDRLDLWRYTAGTDEPTQRAYSLASYPDEKGLVMLIVRIATPPPTAPDAPPGVVSSWLFGLRPGDEVEVAGPYGHIVLPPGDDELVLVGGGAGMAPMRAHLLDLFRRQATRRRVSFWYGARSRRELFYVDLFDGLAAEYANFSWTVALSEPRPEDDWRGETGFIHEVLYRRHLAEHPAPEACDYYVCGPPLMVKAVRTLLDELGVDPERIYADDFGGAAG
jgi:Na+-transporting NADH:ubiquinone oxidoreductase subunit F